MDWARAVEHAKKVLAVPGAHTLARVRSGVMAGMADSELGRLDSGASTFAQAERANRDPVTGQTVSLLAELSILCFESMTTILGGVAMPGLAERLRTATLQAAQRDDRTGLAMAGIAAGTLHGIGTGDGARAEIEFAASLRRFERIEFALWRPLVVHSRIAALTQLGDLAGARALQEEVDLDLVASHRLYRVSGLIVEAQLRAAEGDQSGAAEAAADALAEREAAGTTLPESIDVKRLTHLMGAGEMVPMEAYAPPGILKADLRPVGEHTSDRRTDRRSGDRHEGGHGRSERCRAMPSGARAARRRGAVGHGDAAARGSAVRRRTSVHGRGVDERGARLDDRLGHGRARGLGLGLDHDRDENGADGSAVAELTDREHEIALLVSRQLTNKEIARQLFLSVRTVESHVYTARGKVGARTRRELGRMVAEADGGPTDSRGWRLAWRPTDEGGACRRIEESVPPRPQEHHVPKIVVDVMPKAELLDPQGKAVAGALTPTRQPGVHRRARRQALRAAPSTAPVDADVLAAVREIADDLLCELGDRGRREHHVVDEPGSTAPRIGAA